MLFRCCKVFNNQNLRNLPQRAELALHESEQHSLSDIGASYLSSQQSLGAALNTLINDLEPNHFVYQMVFSDASVNQVNLVVSQAHEALKKTAASKFSAGQSMGFFSWLYDTGYSHTRDDIDQSDLSRVEQHLSASIYYLCAFFSLPVPDITSPSVGNSFNNTRLNQSPTMPQCGTVGGSIQLTPVGRQQVMNGVRQFDFILRGDPDLLPIRGHENATLVRLLHSFSQLINQKYGEAIMEACERNDFIGQLSCVIFSPPLSSIETSMTPISHEELSTLTRPRLSLRHLASYRLMSSLIVLYILFSLTFGLGVGAFIALILGFCAVGIVCKAFAKSLDNKQK